MPRVSPAAQAMNERRCGLSAGQRVGLSPLGVSARIHGQSNLRPDDLGTIRCVPSTTSAVVMWDRFKAPQTLSARYLRPVGVRPATAPVTPKANGTP